MLTESITPLYMARFQCLGDQCEDNCCAVRWNIAVDEEQYKKLQKAMAHSEQDRQKFHRSLQLTTGPDVSQRHYASLQMQPDGQCFFLDPHGLCDLHMTHGPAMLPYTCAAYPRNFNISRQRLEMSGTLSCPELARQCLLAEDAMQLVDYDTARLPYQRVFPTFQRSPESENAYEKYLDDIRALILNLLLDKAFPLRTRLFFTAYFAHRISSFYHQSMRLDSAEKLENEIARMTRPETLHELHRQFGRMEISSTLGMRVIQSISIARTQKDSLAKYNDLLVNILSHYQEAVEVIASPDDTQFTLSLDTLWRDYCNRKQGLERFFGDRIDLIFTNYCSNYWFMEWFTASPDLMVHLRKLLTRVAVLRFLFYSHPDIKKLAQEGPRNQDMTATPRLTVSPRELVDSVAVKTFYIFSRAIEHNPHFLRCIDDMLEDNQMRSLAHMVFLIKF